MKKGFFQMLAIVIFAFLLLANFSCSSCNKPESAKSKSSSSSTSSNTKPSPSSGSLARKESGHKISDLDGQSTRMDEGTLARPDGTRTIKGLDG